MDPSLGSLGLQIEGLRTFLNDMRDRPFGASDRDPRVVWAGWSGVQWRVMCE